MKSRILFLLASIALGVGAYFAAGVLAAGGPTNPAETLWYAGYVTDSEGLPLEGSQNVAIEVFSDPGAAGADLLCTTSTTSPVFSQGHFRVALPANCVTGFQAEGDTWIRLTINGVLMPASRVGAVPYALEASHALNADNADNATNAANATNADNATTASAVAWDDVTGKPATAIGVYTNPITAQQMTIGGSYCGTTSTYTGATIGGLAAAKGYCETACGNSPTAHMCSGAELQREVATGGTIPSPGWVTGFPGGINVNDCQGWTDASSSIGGGYFDSGAGYLTWSACNNGFSILCCD